MRRFIEVNREAHLSIFNGQLSILTDETKNAIPIHEIECLILSGWRGTISCEVMRKLIEEGVSILFGDQSMSPIATIVPHKCVTAAAERLNDQINLSLPKKKQLWKEIVRAKIDMQAMILDKILNDDLTNKRLRQLSQTVLSGDIKNNEAQSAALYWKSLFGKNFCRRNASGANAALNYGYAILRAAFLRTIVSKGLSPLLPLHHSALNNPGALADDLMEPFRPCVDLIVIKHDFEDTLTPQSKKIIVGFMNQKITYDNQTSEISVIISLYINNYVKAITNGTRYYNGHYSFTDG